MLNELVKAAWMLALLLGASPASAQAADQSGSPTIVLIYDPALPQGEATVAAIQAHVTGMPIHMLAEPVPQTSSSLSERLEAPGALAAQRRALGALSIELSPNGDILVFFTEPDGLSALVRRVRANSQELSVVREEAAIVVRSLVQALIEGKRIGMTDPKTSGPSIQRRAARRPAGPPRSPGKLPELEASPQGGFGPEPGSEAGSWSRSESRRRVIAAGAGYIGTRLAPQLGWQSGVALELRWFALPLVYLGGAYSLFPSGQAAAQNAIIALTRHPMELTLGYEGSSPLALTLELSALLDVVHRSTLQAGADYERTRDGNNVMFGVGLRGGLSWGPVSWLRAAARVGADVGARRLSFVSRRDDTETVAESSLLMPRVQVGLVTYLP